MTLVELVIAFLGLIAWLGLAVVGGRLPDPFRRRTGLVCGLLGVGAGAVFAVLSARAGEGVAFLGACAVLGAGAARWLRATGWGLRWRAGVAALIVPAGFLVMLGTAELVKTTGATESTDERLARLRDSLTARDDDQLDLAVWSCGSRGFIAGLEAAMRRRSFDLALGVGGYPDSTSPGTVAALERRLLDTGVPALLVPGPSEADVVSRDGLLACPAILEPIPELLLVVLDTTSGRVDEPTRRWLDTELTARRREHRFCLVASGHAFFDGEGVPAAALLPNVADRIAVGEIVQRHKIDGLLCGGASDYVVTSSSPPQVLCGAGDEMVARVSLGGHRPLVIARERLIPSTEYGASLGSSIGRAEGWLELLRRRGAMAVAFVIALSWAAAIPAWWLGALVTRRERRPRR